MGQSLDQSPVPQAFGHMVLRGLYEAQAKTRRSHIGFSGGDGDGGRQGGALDRPIHNKFERQSGPGCR